MHRRMQTAKGQYQSLGACWLWSRGDHPALPGKELLTSPNQTRFVKFLGWSEGALASLSQPSKLLQRSRRLIRSSSVGVWPRKADPVYVCGCYQLGCHAALHLRVAQLVARRCHCRRITGDRARCQILDSLLSQQIWMSTCTSSPVWVELSQSTPFIRLLKVLLIIKPPSPNPKFSEYIFKRGRYIL